MGVYKVTYGQSLYDVALHIYGSIEGVTDLLVNNETLSLAKTLKADDELIFTDGYILNKEVVAYYKTHNITPSTGERSVYPKQPTLPKIIEVYSKNTLVSGGFTISGSGVIEIDWGDNSKIEVVNVTDVAKSIPHVFDSKVKQNRKITLYMQSDLKSLDISELHPLEMYILRPLYLERLAIKKAVLSLDSLPLLRGLFRLTLDRVETNNLTPILELKELKELSLIGHVYPQPTIDTYLIGLVANYENRRNCRVEMVTEPSPIGMEAIQTIINEPAWNEGGAWEFIINGKIYRYE